MKDLIFRDASLKDIPFLVETIIEAEKSGTDILSYNTVFGLSQSDTFKYLSNMLSEEIDGCELSVTSFLIAEKLGKPIAAVSAWIENANGVPSSVLKGNLLNYSLPTESIRRAMSLNSLLHEMHVDYLPGTIQKGAGYVVREFRGNNLLHLLTLKIIGNLKQADPEVSEIYTQIYGCNLKAISANIKAGFKEIKRIESTNAMITRYLPSETKVIMKKDI